MLRVATWNVNSVKQRLDHLLTFLGDAAPDVVCLQEIKCVDEAFPREPIESAGYTIAVHGQKAYNGVALLSKHPIEVTRVGLPGDAADEQARYLEAVIPHGDGVVRVASIYLPNGNPAPSPKYDYKLAWMDRLAARARELLLLEEPLVLAGDYNVIPTPKDVHNPQSWLDDALFLPQSRASFRELLNLGLADAVRSCDERPGIYTFWDYTGGAFQQNKGIRIDHLLLSPQATDRLRSAFIYKVARSWERPSDHVPVMIDLD